MKNINLKLFVWLLIGISIVFFLIYTTIFPLTEKSVINYLKIIPTVITLDMIFIFLFSKFIWKWKIFKNWLIPFPNMNGTWKGFIHSTWIDPVTNLHPDPIPTILTIEQSFFNISCVMRTAEMSSFSFIGGFVIDKENQILRIVYTYDSIPKQTVKDRSAQHYGSIIFNISENPQKEMFGEYWTGRKTTGNIELTFWKNEKLNKYPDELGLHPVSEIREN